MKSKLLILAVLAALLTAPAVSLDINSSKGLQYYNGNNLEFEVLTSGQVNAQNDINMNGNELTNFFDQSKCGPEQAIKTVYANGSYECNNILQDQTVETLNETLLSGDIANQSIRMNGNDLVDPGQVDGVSIESPGNALIVSGSQYAVDSNSIDTSELASNAVTNTELASGSVNNDSIASFNSFTMQTLDLTSDLTGTGVVNSGQISSGAVGNSEIDNTASITVGALTSDGTIDVNSNNINDISNLYQDDSSTNFFDSNCGAGQVVDGINSDGTFNCVNVDGETTTENLNETLAAGNEANQSIDMMGNSVLNPNLVDNVDLDNPGNALEVSSNQYAVSSNSIGNSEVANSESFTVGGLTSNGNIDANSNNLNDVNNIYQDDSSTNFFASACGSGQVVEGINSDGSYSCVDPVEDIKDETLNQTLLAGDIANQSIRMDGNNITSIGMARFQNEIEIGSPETFAQSGGIAIGEDAAAQSSEGGPTYAIGRNAYTEGGSSGIGLIADEGIAIGTHSNATDGGAIGIGYQAEATTDRSVAIGASSDATGLYSVAIGRTTTSSANQAISIGRNANAGNADAIAIGYNSDASAQGAIALGLSSVADEQYTVELGSSSQGYNLGVHGNTTIHGIGGLDMNDNPVTDVSNIYSDDSSTNFFASACGSGQVVDAVNSDGTYSCVSVDAEATTENLNETLTAGNEANQTINMMNNDVTNIGDLTGTNIVNNAQINSGAVDTSEISSGAVTNTELDNTDSFTVTGLTSDSDIDVNSNNLNDVNNIYSDDSSTNFFASACGSGQVVEKVNSDGSYSCVDPVEDIDTETLNETLASGDIANQSIRMDGNDLENPGLVDGVNVESPGNALEVSSNQYAVSSNSIDTSELASSAVTNTELASGAVNNDSVASFNSFTMQNLDITSDLTGSNIVNSGQINSGAVGTSELATDSVTNDSIDNTETVMLNGGTMTADVDLNSNNLNDVNNIYGDDSSTNFFSGACSSGKVVEKVNSDGSYSCVDPVEDIQDETLNQTLLAGDIANQSIRMDGNNITDLSYLTSEGSSLKIEGDLDVSGSIDETFADLAEIYQSDQELEKGEIVRISRTRDEAVERSTERYGESVGVVSTKPGYVMNADEDGYPIALTGKVPVKVNMENGEIERGDRIVPSSTEGEGMRCEKWSYEREDKSTRNILEHNQKCEDAVIGKALETASTNGKIMVMIDE